MPVGKYKAYAPITVAEMAWGKLTEPATIRRMIDRYTEKIRNLPTDEDAYRRYLTGVALWTDTMREHAADISQVIARAKADYYAKRSEALRRIEAGEPVEEVIRAVVRAVVPAVAPRVERIAVPAE